MPVTMRDVAREAGVSIKTVSRVVNQQGEIKDETRERVLAAIDKLGYRPSKVARALVTRRTDTIGLLVGLLGAWLITRIGFFRTKGLEGLEDAQSVFELMVFLGLGFLGLMLALRSNREEFSLLKGISVGGTFHED